MYVYKNVDLILNACFSFQDESSKQTGKSKKIRKDNKKRTEH